MLMYCNLSTVSVTVWIKWYIKYRREFAVLDSRSLARSQGSHDASNGLI